MAGNGRNDQQRRTVLSEGSLKRKYDEMEAELSNTKAELSNTKGRLDTAKMKLKRTEEILDDVLALEYKKNRDGKISAAKDDMHPQVKGQSHTYILEQAGFINKQFKTVEFRILKSTMAKNKMRENFLKLSGGNSVSTAKQAVMLNEGFKALNNIVVSKRSHEVKVIREKFGEYAALTDDDLLQEEHLESFFVDDYADADPKVKDLFLFAYAECAFSLSTSISTMKLKKDEQLDIEKYHKAFTSADAALVRAVMLLPSLKKKRDMLAREARKTAKAARRAAEVAERAAKEAETGGSEAAGGGDSELSDDDDDAGNEVAGSSSAQGTTVTNSTGTDNTRAKSTGKIKKKPGVKKGQLSIDKEWNTFERYWKLESQLRLKEDPPDFNTGGQEESSDETEPALDTTNPLNSTKKNIMSWYDAALGRITDKKKKKQKTVPENISIDTSNQKDQGAGREEEIDQDFFDAILNAASV